MKWIELDAWLRATGQEFDGSDTELGRHLGDLVPDGRVTYTVEKLPVRLDTHLFKLIHTSVTTLHTPWGRYRWIPKPRTGG